LPGTRTGPYYIESNGEVAIIHPLREVQSYIDKALKQNAKIKYIFETHFHADFVSGHVTLAKKQARLLYMDQMHKHLLKQLLQNIFRNFL
jgi:glyoxylase-like metal-dependent hydrolase (beta-lactamase superfamily II)